MLWLPQCCMSLTFRLMTLPVLSLSWRGDDAVTQHAVTGQGHAACQSWASVHLTHHGHEQQLAFDLCLHLKPNMSDTCEWNCVQAVEVAVTAAVAEATAAAVDQTKQEMEATQAAAKAVADAQQLRELDDRVQALQEQLASSSERLNATDTALLYASQLECCHGQLVSSSECLNAADTALLYASKLEDKLKIPS